VRRLERDVAWNLIPVALLGIIGLGLNLVIGRVWGAEALGVFNQVTSVYMVFAIIGSGAMQYSILREVAARPADDAHVAAVTRGGLVPGIGFAVVATGLFVALHGPVAAILKSPAVGTGMLWAAPGVFCFSINKLLLAVTNGLARMRAYAMYTSTRYLLIGSTLGVAVACDVEVTTLPGLWSIVEGVLLLVLAGETFVVVSLRRGHEWRRWARMHTSFGARSSVSMLAIELGSRLDVWMVGIALSDASVGVYAMAATLAEGAMQIPVAVQASVNPRIAESLARGDTAAVDTMVRTTRRWFVPAMIGACVLGTLAFPFIIPVLTGDTAFAEGSAPFALLMLGVALACPWLPFNQMLLMGGRPSWHSLVLVVMVATNALAQVVFVPAFGLVGAGAGTAIALVVSAVLLRLSSRRLLGVHL
jgi:stage V sporulation protein B